MLFITVVNIIVDVAGVAALSFVSYVVLRKLFNWIGIY